jgi:phenylpropionate dioxygenase-like ring-hydroxylating dioxygenase large terminal subunit
MPIRSDWERELLNRLFTLVESRVQPMAAHMATLPVENYGSRERFEREQRHVFRRFALLAGFSSQVREPGDFFTRELGGVPILVTRDEAGALRAFLNVCRHRGARLVQEPQGSGRKMFACSYHGWRYSCAGTLRAVPHLPGFPELAREQRGLVALPVAERHGLVFVRSAPGPDIALDEFLGPLFEELETLGMPQRQVFASSTRTVHCNWRLMVDSVLEAYHIAVLHRSTGGLAFEENLMLFDESAPPHGRFVLPARGLKRPSDGSAQDWRLLDHASALYWMFPNSVVLFQGGLANFLSIFPVDDTHCVVHGASLCLGRPEDEATRARLQQDYDGYWATIREDLRVTEGIQAGLDSGANREFLLGRFEYVVDKYFHGALEEALQGRLQP